MEKFFQNLRLKQKHSLSNENKTFVARETQYFEPEILSFILYLYYLTRNFIASICAFNYPTCTFSFPTRAFNFATCDFSLLTREFKLVTREFELVTGALLLQSFLLFDKF